MLKGTQRKVIVLKDTQSGIFDEAYFIVKKSADSKNLTTNDMVMEAERIIKLSASGERETKKSEKLLRPLWFFLGVLCADIIFIISILAERNYL
ncbi:MAG: hypothetical protein IKL21_01555 [Clostridia bacterium]|jgi:hypothetical protein|nr:hypothetical protein [Clostridia bacterium]